MNRIILQLWEESNKENEPLTSGCSLHISESIREEYINNIYINRGDIIPEVYDRVLGKQIEAFIVDDLYEILLKEKSIRLSEVEMNNLINYEDLIIKL